MVIVAEAVGDGARQRRACEIVCLDVRTYQRWSVQGPGGDRRMGPKTEPANKLNALERQRIIEVATSMQFRDMSPKQIVPHLADFGEYFGSESSFYRVLRDFGAMAHRSPARRPTATAPREHAATGPGQVWSWDITYLRSAVRGAFHYLYLIEDVWSRKIVGWAVHDEEDMEHAAALITAATASMRVDARNLVLHSDNGGPMKGSTMLATLQRLGIVASFSRPKRERRQSVFRIAVSDAQVPARVPAEAIRFDRRSACLGDLVRRLVQRRAPAQRDRLRHPGAASRRRRRIDPRTPHSGLREGTSASPWAMER